MKTHKVYYIDFKSRKLKKLTSVTIDNNGEQNELNQNNTYIDYVNDRVLLFQHNRQKSKRDAEIATYATKQANRNIKKI